MPQWPHRAPARRAPHVRRQVVAGWLRGRAGEIAQALADKEAALKKEAAETEDLHSELNVLRAAADTLGVRLSRKGSARAGGSSRRH